MADFTSIPSDASVSPEPFMLNVSEDAINEFKSLLRASKLATPTWESIAGNLGLQHAWLSHAKDIWLNAFNWRDHENFINSFPNFTAEPEEGFRIHFSALFSERKDAIPIVFLHGWPGQHSDRMSAADCLLIQS